MHFSVEASWMLMTTDRQPRIRGDRRKDILIDDTLISRLSTNEVVAVTARELFKDERTYYGCFSIGLRYLLLVAVISF